MIFLYCYLGVGALVLAIVFGYHWLTKKNEPELLSTILDDLYPSRKKLLYRILYNFAIPVITAVAVLIVWPVGIYMSIKERFSKKSNLDFEEKREFDVQSTHLQERLTITQIEAREVVKDPLRAVPNLPFGHLNAVWNIFIESVGADDELWSFTAPGQNSWGRDELRTGYVVVRHGVPGAHCLIRKTEIEDEFEEAGFSTDPGTASTRKASN